MGDLEIIHSANPVDDVSEFLDVPSFNKIINKLTDYAEIISEGKLAGIINFNYTLTSTQTNRIIEMLLAMQSVSRIYTLALKGSRDLESEYISNIFSDPSGPDGLSSYLNLRNLLENRLSHQTQQYNMNMGKNNTTMAMPLNELRGHVKTFIDLSKNQVTVSNKAQHGIIAASLHDAYVIILNRTEYWNDKTYMKFFFNDDDPSRRDHLLVSKEIRLSIFLISKNIEDARERLSRAMAPKPIPSKRAVTESVEAETDIPPALEKSQDPRSRAFTDKMLLTPFGKQYGLKIDEILNEIFSPVKEKTNRNLPEDSIREVIVPLFELYRNSAPMNDYRDECRTIVNYLISQDFSVKTMAEKFLHANKKEPFIKFFSEPNKYRIEDFLTRVFNIYFETEFEPIFRIIKSLDMKKFACAYIMKRIYLTRGDNITNFGYFFIRTIAKTGGIKML